ncbi:cation transporter dimerization domain-containing protein, partial [uncultured Brachyspira sp.]
HIYGAHTEITFHIRFPKDMTVFEAHNMATLLENEIREKLFIEATIHIEAY